MTSPQTESRNHKIRLLRELNGLTIDLFMKPKKHLQTVHISRIKQVLEEVRSWL